MQISTIQYTDTNKAYFAVRNQPFVILGAQIRLDGLLHRPDFTTHETLGEVPPALTHDEIEVYFQKAKELGFNTVEVPIDWRFIEPVKDQYDFTLLDFVLDTVKKYDLKMELLWFSTNMCGDSHSNHLPDYIFNDKETYPRIQGYNGSEYVDQYYSLMYGYSGFLVLNDPDLMARETKVLTKIMDHVYDWNVENDLYDPIISVQVHNESDGLVRWRVDQFKLQLDGQRITKEFAWQMTLDALDNAGQAIKNSRYQVVTRANMTVSMDMDKFGQYPEGSPKDVLALSGIDIVGDDPYVEEPLLIKTSLESYSQNGNYPHIAENMGNYMSTPQMILTAVLNGGSYSVYDLATPEYFVWMNRGNSYQMDQGILNPDFSRKPQTDATMQIMRGIEKASPLFALLDTDQMTGFNFMTKEIADSLAVSVSTKNLTVSIETDDQAFGYMMEADGYLYLFMTEDATVHFNQTNILPVGYTGYFDGQDFIQGQKVYPAADFLLHGGELYQFKLA